MATRYTVKTPIRQAAPAKQVAIKKALTRDELDIKYQTPERCGNFKVFVGNYKDRTFREVAADKQYADWLLRQTGIRSNNIYLLQRYLHAIRDVDGNYNAVEEEGLGEDEPAAMPMPMPMH